MMSLTKKCNKKLGSVQGNQISEWAGPPSFVVGLCCLRHKLRSECFEIDSDVCVWEVTPSTFRTSGVDDCPVPLLAEKGSAETFMGTLEAIYR